MPSGSGIMGVIYRVSGYSKIFMHADFPVEFKEICYPQIKRYQKWLDRNLRSLQNNNLFAVDHTHIEKLRDTDPPIYAIRSPNSKLNPRVLFCFFDADNRCCLLHTFKEKSSSDYDDALTVAQHRMKLVQEEWLKWQK